MSCIKKLKRITTIEKKHVIKLHSVQRDLVSCFRFVAPKIHETQNFSLEKYELGAHGC